jgi:hypothetical protein
MIKRKFLLLFLVGALTAASTFVVQTKNSNALQPGSVVTQEAEQLPEHVQYKFLFHHIRVLKEQADEIERQGKGRSGLLSRFEEDLGIEGPHFQRLTQVAPQVFVYENQVTPEVLIRLGPKAAVSGQITDVKTGKPIKNARLTLRRADNSDNSYSTGLNESGQFEVLVPSGPFTITVSAPGYRTWKYKSSRLSVQANSLQLLSGDRKELKISLDPVE